MSEEEKESFTFNILPNEFVYIPFDKTGYKLSFRYNNSEENIYSSIIKLKKVIYLTAEIEWMHSKNNYSIISIK